ncbi:MULTISPECIES: 3'-5' exonuclease [unclassified Bacillus cereus group]|uniref:3'-5' exonuclease n=1 Tax=unclassified Bacillus cereus group TaxID=2750818 RepID=UPI0029C390AC|nr:MULTISPECIES: 3'-5' exonuclease [unclassified Bacillus cereus group]MDX5880822.1 3'-5' exonuclease [Bacillus cereus group sp. BfR-BA-01042]MDX5906684.1 3'-5' exonuclease [Bacillus cereus group sp. BfR-BA-01048]
MEKFKYWNEVPEECYLKSQLKEMGLRPKSEEDAIGQIYVKSFKKWCKLYKKEDCIPIKKMSEEHKAAIKKSHEKYICEECGGKDYKIATIQDHFAGYLQKHKRITMSVIKNHLEKRWCRYCANVFFEEVDFKLHQIEYRKKFKRTLKKGYVMLKVETTGLTSWDEIIQIAIVDQDEKVLLHTYLQPEAEISTEARYKHGKENKDLVNEPKWVEIYPQVKEIIENNRVFVFNAEFVLRLLQATNGRYDLPYMDCKKVECLMWRYSCYMNYESEYITMSSAAGAIKTNEALHDCLLIHKIIHRMIDNKK